MKSKNTIEAEQTKDSCCLSCFKKIKEDVPREILERKVFLCDDCISQVKTKLAITKINGVFVLFLGEYDGIMKKWLMDFKEYGDIELSKCFLYLYLPLIHLLFPDYIFVPCPSSFSRNEKRGFVHLEEMLKAYSLPYVLALDKISEEENKTLSASGRGNIASSIRLNSNGESLKNRKVVIFDDVMTSGNTFLSSAREVRKANPKKIRGLILMRTKRPDYSL